MNAKHPAWNHNFSNYSGLKLLEILLAPTSKSQPHNDTLLHIMIDKNVCPSDVNVADILDSYDLTILFTITEPVRTREASDPAGKLTDWELLQSLVSELISPNIQIHFLMRLIKQHVNLQPT
jgi:hypothetical protein